MLGCCDATNSGAVGVKESGKRDRDRQALPRLVLVLFECPFPLPPPPFSFPSHHASLVTRWGGGDRFGGSSIRGQGSKRHAVSQRQRLRRTTSSSLALCSTHPYGISKPRIQTHPLSSPRGTRRGGSLYVCSMMVASQPAHNYLPTLPRSPPHSLETDDTTGVAYLSIDRVGCTNLALVPVPTPPCPAFNGGGLETCSVHSRLAG